MSTPDTPTPPAAPGLSIYELEGLYGWPYPANDPNPHAAGIIGPVMAGWTGGATDAGLDLKSLHQALDSHPDIAPATNVGEVEGWRAHLAHGGSALVDIGYDPDRPYDIDIDSYRAALSAGFDRLWTSHAPEFTHHVPPGARSAWETFLTTCGDDPAHTALLVALAPAWRDVDPTTRAAATRTQNAAFALRNALGATEDLGAQLTDLDASAARPGRGDYGFAFARNALVAIEKVIAAARPIGSTTTFVDPLTDDPDTSRRWATTATQIAAAPHAAYWRANPHPALTTPPVPEHYDSYDDEYYDAYGA